MCLDYPIGIRKPWAARCPAPATSRSRVKPRQSRRPRLLSPGPCWAFFCCCGLLKQPCSFQGLQHPRKMTRRARILAASEQKVIECNVPVRRWSPNSGFGEFEGVVLTCSMQGRICECGVQSSSRLSFLGRRATRQVSNMLDAGCKVCLHAEAWSQVCHGWACQ